MVGNISAAIDTGCSVVGGLQSKIDSLPTNVDSLSTTLEKISAAVDDVSTVIETLSVKVGSISMAIDSLSAKTDSISNTIGKLSGTMGEIVKRERMAMEKFSTLSSRMGWPIPVVLGLDGVAYYVCICFSLLWFSTFELEMNDLSVHSNLEYLWWKCRKRHCPHEHSEHISRIWMTPYMMDMILVVKNTPPVDAHKLGSIQYSTIMPRTRQLG